MIILWLCVGLLVNGATVEPNGATVEPTFLCPDSSQPKKDDAGQDLTCDNNHRCPAGFVCTKINARISRCCPRAPGGKGTCAKNYVSFGDPALHAEFGNDWASAYMAVNGRQDMAAARDFAQKYAQVAEASLLQEVAKKAYVESTSEVFFDGVHPRTTFPKDTSESVMHGDFSRKSSDGPADGYVDEISKLLEDFNTTYLNVVDNSADLRSQFPDLGRQSNTNFDAQNYSAQIQEQVAFLRKQAAENQFRPNVGTTTQPDFACNGQECQTLGAPHDPLSLNENGSPCKGDFCLQGVQANGQCTSSSCFSFTSDEVPPIEDYDRLQWGVFDWRFRSEDGKEPGPYSFVTSVKDQNACGSCWDFAATGAFESAIARQFGLFLKSEWVTGPLNRYNPTDLSEQTVLDHANGGCGGSSAKDACDNVFEKFGGTPLTIEDYASHGFNQTCTDSKMPCTINGQVLKQTFASIPTTAYNPRASGHAEYWNDGKPFSEGEIRSRLENEGPFAVGVWANFGNWAGIGVYDNPGCSANHTANACNTSAHPEWCGADQGVNHVVLLVGYGSQLVNTCKKYNFTHFCIFGNWFCFDIRDKCIEYGPAPVNFWIVKNSWSWRGWAYHKNDTLGNEGGGYIKMRSGSNICNLEEYLFKSVPQSVEISGSTSIDFPFGIHFEFPTFGPRDICFNKDNTASVQLAGTDYEVKFNQADCYSYLCNYNRTKIEKSLVNQPGGPMIGGAVQQIPEVGKNLPWFDRSDFLGFENLGREPSNIRNAKLPTGWCEKNLNTPNGFCKTATPYCSYGSTANGHKQGDPVNEGDVDPNSILQTLRAVFGAIFGADPYSKTAVCQLWRDLCAKKFFWQSVVSVADINLADLTWPSKISTPKSFVDVFPVGSPTPKPRPEVPRPPVPRPPVPRPPVPRPTPACPPDTINCRDGSTVTRDLVTCQFPACPPTCPSGDTPTLNDDGSFMSCDLASSSQCPPDTSCQTTDQQQNMCCPCPPCRLCAPGSTCQCGICVMSPTPAPLFCVAGTPLMNQGDYWRCDDDSACAKDSSCQWDSTNSQRICCSCPPCPNCGFNAMCQCGKCVAAPTPAYSCTNGNVPISNADGVAQLCSADSDCPPDSSCDRAQFGQSMLAFTFVPVSPVSQGVCCPCPPCRFACIRGQTCQCGQCVQAPTPSVVCPDGSRPLDDTRNGGYLACSNFASFMTNSCPPQSTCQSLDSGSFCCPCSPCAFACPFDQTCQCGQCVQTPTPSVVCPDGQSPVQICAPQTNLMMLVRRPIPSCPEGTSCQQIGIQSMCCPCRPCVVDCFRGSTCRCGECVPNFSPTESLPTPAPPTTDGNSPTSPFLRLTNARDIARLLAVPTPAPFRLTSLNTNLNFPDLFRVVGRPTYEPPR